MFATPFGHEVLQELRAHTRVFLKLDFAYIAAGGAVVTFLKIGSGELAGFGASVSIVVLGLIALVTVDTFANAMVFDDWLSARTGEGKRLPSKLLRVLLFIQPMLHLIFVGLLMSSAIGYASGVTEAKARMEGRVLLQEEVELFMLKTGSPPKSLDALKAASSRVATILSKNLDGEGAIVEPTGAKTYRIIFAGWDNKFGTSDDMVVTQDLLLRKVWDSMESDSKTSGAEK